MTASPSLTERIRQVPVALLVAFGFAKIVQLGVGVAIARGLDKDLAGIAFYLLTVIAFAQMIVAIGLDNNAWYVLQRYLARQRLSAYWRYIVAALLVALPASVVVSLQLLLDPDLAAAPGIGWVVLAIALTTVMTVFRRFARGAFTTVGERIRATVHEAAIANTVLIALILLWPTGSVLQLGLLILAANLVSLPWAVADLHRAMPLPALRKLVPSWRTTRIFVLLALPGLVSQATQLVVNQADMLILAPLAGPAEVADYGAAKRLTHLLTGVGDLIAVVYGTRIVLEQEQPVTQQQAFYRRIAWQTLLLIAPLCAIVLAFPALLLSLIFGDEYTSAAPILSVLVISRLLTVPFYALMPVFVMRRQTRPLAAISTCAAALNIALNLLLIPDFGGLGAAWASLASMAVLGIGLGWLFRSQASRHP